MTDAQLTTHQPSSADRAKATEAGEPKALQPSPNATYPAAAEFARTFAPGAAPMSTEDQKMSIPKPGHESPASVLAAAAPGALLSLHTTTIPSLGMTFTEAAERYATLLAEHNAIDENTDPKGSERMVELVGQWCAIEDAVSAFEPRTIGDCMAVLRIATHRASPLRDGEFNSPSNNGSDVFNAMLRAATFLSSATTGTNSAPAVALATSAIPSLGITFGEALARWRAVPVPTSNEAMDARTELEGDVLGVEPSTIGDALVMLEMLDDQAKEGGIVYGDGLRRAFACLAAALPFTISQHVADAFGAWRRAEEFSEWAQGIAKEAPEDTEEFDTLECFTGTPFSLFTYAVRRSFFDTPSLTMADCLLKLRAAYMDDEGIFSTTVAEQEAVTLVNSISLPVYDKWEPSAVIGHHPAELLANLDLPDGNLLAALMVSYLRAKAGAADLSKVLDGMEAFGAYADQWDLEHLSTAGNDYSPVLRALNDDECREFAETGIFPDAAMARLDAEREASVARREEERRFEAKQEQARKAKEDREKHGPPLAELLQPVLPNFSDGERKAVSSIFFGADFIATIRETNAEHMAALSAERVAELATADFSAIKHHRMDPHVLDIMRQELRVLASAESAGTVPTVADPALQIYEEFCTAVAHLDAHTAGPWSPGGSSEWRAYDKANVEAAELVLSICIQAASVPATTLAGVVAKWCMFTYQSADSVCHAMGLLWRSIVQDAERIGAVPLVPFLHDFAAGKTPFGIVDPAPAAAPQPDTFTDTIAAFEAEAPKPLCMPQAPTAAMLEAGAAALGITPEAFRSGYVAAVEAFKLEKAA